MHPGKWFFLIAVLGGVLGMSFPLAADTPSGTFKVTKSKVSFSSEMPLELIRASSNALSGVLDIKSGTFSFSLPISSFQGFNNPLQQEHFNENYMETGYYPLANYKGKLIEDIDIQKPGRYKIRTKGKLWIHGVSQSLLIPVTIVVLEGRIRFSANFSLLLTDYAIKIPRIVDKNLANEIQVSVEGEFVPL